MYQPFFKDTFVYLLGQSDFQKYRISCVPFVMDFFAMPWNVNIFSLKPFWHWHNTLKVCVPHLKAEQKTKLGVKVAGLPRKVISDASACACGFWFIINNFRVSPSGYTAAGRLLGSKHRSSKSPVGWVAAEQPLCCRHWVSRDRFQHYQKKPGGCDQCSWNMAVPVVSTASISPSVSSEALTLHLQFAKSQVNISRQERGVKVKCSDENLEVELGCVIHSSYSVQVDWLPNYSHSAAKACHFSQVFENIFHSPSSLFKL